MRAGIFISLAFTALATAVATQDEIPDLPDGWFTGFNHDNGTNTLIFHKTGQEINFMPRAPTASPAKADVLSKRSGAACWSALAKLPTAGTDTAIQEWRDTTSEDLVYVGNGGSGCGDNPDFPPYFGYNSGGVYVYFCFNSNDQAHDSADFNDVQFATLQMDQSCGAYVPGYYQWDSPSLFGKCASGTSVCVGNSRS